MKHWSPFLLGVFAALSLGCTRSAEVYKTATSPDGRWTVEVLRKKYPLYPLTDGVEVIVRVKDANRTILFDQRIDARDLWVDVQSRYHDVICRNDAILVGPQYWDGKSFTYFRLDPTKLTSPAR